MSVENARDYIKTKTNMNKVLKQLNFQNKNIEILSNDIFSHMKLTKEKIEKKTCYHYYLPKFFFKVTDTEKLECFVSIRLQCSTDCGLLFINISCPSIMLPSENDDEYETILYTCCREVSYNDFYEECKNTVKKLLNLNRLYIYSKILDKIVKKSNYNKELELNIAKNFICGIDTESTECCICLEKNSPDLKILCCSQSLCRCCMASLKELHCPMCRTCYESEHIH